MWLAWRRCKFHNIDVNQRISPWFLSWRYYGDYLSVIRIIPIFDIPNQRPHRNKTCPNLPSMGKDLCPAVIRTASPNLICSDVEKTSSHFKKGIFLPLFRVLFDCSSILTSPWETRKTKHSKNCIWAFERIVSIRMKSSRDESIKTLNNLCSHHTQFGNPARRPATIPDSQIAISFIHMVFWKE
jgi:hypothetical protein